MQRQYAVAYLPAHGTSNGCPGVTATPPPSPPPTATPAPPTATMAPTATLAPTAAPTATPAPVVAGTFAFSSYIAGKKAEIYVINSDGTGLTRLAKGPASFLEHPDWSPDGTRIVYHGGEGDYPSYSVWAMNADGSEQTQLTKAPVMALWPKWSPDGSQIAFTHWDPDTKRMHIWVVNADGSDARPVTSGEGTNDNFPTWAPNGTILFQRSEVAPGTALPCAPCWGDIFAVQPDGTGLVRLTKMAKLGDYGLSPDGTRIAVHDKARNQVVVLPADGGTSPPLKLVEIGKGYVSVPGGLGSVVEDAKNDLAVCASVAPAWSPDGSAVAVACSSWGGAQSGLWVVNADGTGLARVPNAGAAYDPVGSPAREAARTEIANLGGTRSTGGPRSRLRAAGHRKNLTHSSGGRPPPVCRRPAGVFRHP